MEEYFFKCSWTFVSHYHECIWPITFFFPVTVVFFFQLTISRIFRYGPLYALSSYSYRPQRSSGKVIFSQACVILFTGGGGLVRGSPIFFGGGLQNFFFFFFQFSFPYNFFWDAPPPPETVNARAVRILLECILVVFCLLVMTSHSVKSSWRVVVRDRLSEVRQGSHSDWKTWKTWKNGKAFSSQGKVREFWTDWKSQGKSHKILENSGNLR